MNVEIRAEAAQFPEKEYINGISIAVQIFQIQSIGNTPICFACLQIHINILLLITPHA
jgi:hypothetical protein